MAKKLTLPESITIPGKKFRTPTLVLKLARLSECRLPDLEHIVIGNLNIALTYMSYAFDKGDTWPELLEHYNRHIDSSVLNRYSAVSQTRIPEYEHVLIDNLKNRNIYSYVRNVGRVDTLEEKFLSFIKEERISVIRDSFVYYIQHVCDHYKIHHYNNGKNDQIQQIANDWQNGISVDFDTVFMTLRLS